VVLNFDKRIRKKGRWSSEQRAALRCLPLKDLKAKDIEMELTNVYNNEALQISAGKKRRTGFLQEKTKLGHDP
jgi:hypothetical protein